MKHNYNPSASHIGVYVTNEQMTDNKMNRNQYAKSNIILAINPKADGNPQAASRYQKKGFNNLDWLEGSFADATSDDNNE